MVTFEAISDPATLEVLACREALVLAQDLMLGRIQIASDSKCVVEEINQGEALGRYGMLIKEIETRKQRFQESIFGHERREANGEAHSLARMAMSLAAGRQVWLGHPPENVCIPVNISIDQRGYMLTQPPWQLEQSH